MCPAQSGVARRALAYAQPYYDAIDAAHAYAGLGGGMAEGTFYGNFTAFAQTLTAEALYTAAGVDDAYTRSPFYLARLRYAIHASWPGYLTNQYRVQHPPARAGLRRCAPRAHRIGAVPPRHGPAARQAFPRDAGRARGVLGREPRRNLEALHPRVVALRRAVLVRGRAAGELPTALAYREPSLGQVFARSDWSTTPPG